MIKSNFVKYILLFVFLVLLQVVVLNEITFLGYAVPFLYIYFIIKLPFSLNRNLVILLGFILGLTIDIFCNTLGINAAATTLAAFFCRPIQSLFFNLDDFKEQTVPKLSFMGASFMKYAISITLLHNIALISIESFSYFNIEVILLRIFLSTAITSIIIFALEGFSIKKDKKTWQKN